MYCYYDRARVARRGGNKSLLLGIILIVINEIDRRRILVCGTFEREG